MAKRRTLSQRMTAAENALFKLPTRSALEAAREALRAHIDGERDPDRRMALAGVCDRIGGALSWFPVEG